MIEFNEIKHSIYDEIEKMVLQPGQIQIQSQSQSQKKIHVIDKSDRRFVRNKRN